MPIETKRQAEVLKKLQDVLKHTDTKIVSGRKLAIKRWVETYIEHIKYFKDDKLGFLYNVFRDEACWLGTRLNNTVLGQRLTEEKIGEIDNPLRMYEMACSYCVVGKILPLFQKRFEFLKSKFPHGKFDGRTETEIDKYVRNSLLDTIKMNGRVFDFWIDRESGKLEEPSNAVEGFDSAVKLKWSEGVEYFYNQLEKKDKEEKLTEAIIALSRPQSVEKDAPILDFCVNNIPNKDNLLKELLQKGKGIYFLFVALIDSCFFDTVHDLVQCWFYNWGSERGDHSEKILSQREYEIFLSSLAKAMLKNPELSIQARFVIMEIWRCDRLGEYRKAAIINTSTNRVPIKVLLGSLIVNWKREDVCKSDREKEIEKEEIFGMMSFAGDSFPKKFKIFREMVIKHLRQAGREGKKKGMDYGKLAEELFSKLEESTLPPRDDGSGDHQRRSIVEAEDSSPSIRHDGSGDGPQSELGTPSVSGVSDSHKKKSIFTLSGSLSNK